MQKDQGTMTFCFPVKIFILWFLVILFAALEELEK